MTRPARIIAWTLASFVALLAILVMIIATFDWNRVKPMLNEKVSEALHRPFAINGNLAVRWQREPEEGGWRAWVPWPRFIADDLTLGNPDWAKEPRMVGLERVEFRLSPLPLLAQRITIPRIDLTKPDAQLTRLADGRANWTFDLGPKDENAEPSSWELDIGSIRFDQGNVRYDDQMLKASVKVQIDPLGKPIPFSEIVGKERAEKTGNAQDYAFGLKAEGRYKGEPVSGTGKIGGLLALRDSEQPFPIQADVRAADTRVVLAGTVTDPLNLGALDLRLRLSGKSLGNLYPLTGVTLPDTPPYSTDGHLTANLQDKQGMRFRYEGFNGKIGNSDIHGTLAYAATQPRPKLSGELVSNQLLFDDLAPLIGADSNTEQKARGGASKQPTDKVLPVEEFRTERWRAMDADVKFTGKRIVHSKELPFNDLSAHVLLEDGLLRLNPLRFGVAGGNLESRIRLDGRNVPLQGHAKLSARGFKLKQLFPSFAPMQTSFGELNGDADLRGRGNSVAALLGSSNGDLRLLINDGAISRSLMEIAGLNVGNYLVDKLFGDEEVKINCAAADVGIKEGLASTRVFVFDTENAIIYVDGNVNLASERMDLEVSPESKGFRLFSLRSPLYVRGTFAKPNAGVKAVPLALRGAGMLALGATVGPAAGLLALIAPGDDVPDQCRPLLEKVKAGKK